MPTPRITLSHPTGNPNVYNAALAFQEIGLLHEVITTFSSNKLDWLLNFINKLPTHIRKKVLSELSRRKWKEINNDFLKTHAWQEIIRISLEKTTLSAKFGITNQLVNWIYTSLDTYTAKYHIQNIDAVYAYEDGAATTFKIAKQKGILCLYDLPILFYSSSYKIQAEEAEYFPELSSALQAAQEPNWKIARKQEEVQLADHIFVASSATQKSLLSAGVKSKKISIIPYGAPVDYFNPTPKLDSCFRALFVGRVGPRKGVHYLLKAWQKLSFVDAELLLVGVNEFPDRWLATYQNTFRYIPSVPHASLNNYYSSASVFVFPSLVEGFGLVLLEAMACGIPIITTPNTAGPDIITDGVEGFIVPIRDIDALQEKLEWCYNNPRQLAEMGKAARQKAEQLTWELYRKRLGSKVQQLLQKQTILY